MRRWEDQRVFSVFARKLQALIVPFLLLALSAQTGRAADALSYFKSYYVTGDYVIAGVGLRGTGVNGLATGTINVGGVPAGADLVAAFLYWETEESSPTPVAMNGFFDGHAIVGRLLGNPMNPACWSSGGTTGASNGGASGRVYRADVLRYLTIDTTNSVRLANGPHTVSLTDNGGNGNGNILFTDGASLVVIYRLMAPGAAPLRAVVIYDGTYTMSKSMPAMTQSIGGFYQASPTAAAKMSQIVANGQPGFIETLAVNGTTLASNPFTGTAGVRWDNPTFNINLASNAASYTTQVSSSDNQTCLTWGAIVTSTAVTDTDADGLLDAWETNGFHLNDQVSPATFGGCADYPAEPCVNLPAMGASPSRKDIFVEIDWLHGSDGHSHAPKLDALNAIGATFAKHNIQLHFDVGNNYQGLGSPYIVPGAYTQGGEVVEESTLLCPNSRTNVCAFPNLPYSVQGWKIGFRAVKDGFPALNIPPHFAHNRKDIFHYVLFAHALAIPFSPPIGLPKSVSGVADRPGGDVMVTLGLWRSDAAGDDQTGSSLVQAGTLMHELGHNLGLSHAGLFRAPNCMPNYPSVMNYLYQTRGLTDSAGQSHIDYSSGVLPSLIENSLFANSLGVTPYRIRFYGPLSPLDATLNRQAKLHCDGTPLTGDLAVRLESPVGPIDWQNNGFQGAGPDSADVNFNGFTADPFHDSVDPTKSTSDLTKRWFVDSNDWGNLNLQQISARMNVAGLSADVGQTDLGQTDLGQTDLGQTDLGQTDLGQTDLGQTDLGQTDLGQTDLGDVDYDTVISTLDATSSSQPLTAASSLTAITLNWGAPGIGQIRHYNIYRSDPVNTAPVLIGHVDGAPPASTFTDTVDSSTTLYNTTYTYFVVSVDINGTSSGPSNTAIGIVKHLFITANDKSRVYGAANPAFDFTTTGLDPGLSGTTTCTTTATASSSVGTYPITCSGLTPAAGVTYRPGTLTITKANATIVVTPYSVTYDTNQHSATGTATGSLGEALGGLDLSGTTHINAGTYPTDPWTFTNPNYNTASGTVSDAIAKAIAIIAVTPYNVTYDANPHTATGTATGVKGEALAGLNLSGTTHIDAGTYPTDPWTFTNANYKDASGAVSDSIAKANAIVTVVGGTFIHDGNPHPATGAVTGLGGAVIAAPLFTYTPPGNSTAPVNIGSYTVVGSFPGNNNYNAAVSAPAAIKINGFVTTGSMGTARSFHTATLLGNGKVLVTGGFNTSGAPLASSELYDPASGTFSVTPNNMPNKAAGHTATLLGNGKVLVAGGGNASSELYDPATNLWSSAGGMSSQRTYHTATLLPNGKVLIAGGSANNGVTTNSAQLYDPVSGNFTATGSMTVSRDFHTATLLTSGPNAGQVLITGGRTSSGKGYTYLSTAELYDPGTGTFTAISGSMTAARYGQAAAVITSGVNAGMVLIAGGANTAALSSAELYDPVAGTFSATNPLATARQYFTATVIGTGVLEAGGLNGAGQIASAEQYQASAFIPSDIMAAARDAHTATRLVNGSVLIAGGQGSTGVSISSAELFVVIR